MLETKHAGMHKGKKPKVTWFPRGYRISTVHYTRHVPFRSTPARRSTRKDKLDSRDLTFAKRFWNRSACGMHPVREPTHGLIQVTCHLGV